VANNILSVLDFKEVFSLQEIQKSDSPVADQFQEEKYAVLRI